MKPNRPPRAPAKSTPFAAASGASGSEGQVSRSRSHRATMTTSLRKAKRGQTVARKRHMKLPLGSAPMATTQAQRENPYTRDGAHVKETREVATSVVRVCSQGGGLSSSTMGDLLDRMCILLTPNNDANDNTRGLKTPPVGASYDSSMAGIAANSLLSQFVDGVGNQPPDQQQLSQRNNLAFLLANALAHNILDTTNYTPTTRTIQIKAAIVLNQLAATEPPPPLASSFDQEHFTPYGHPQTASPSEIIASAPTSWCYVISSSNALPALVQQLPLPASKGNPSDMEICGKCIHVIGNLAGESEMAREALRKMEALNRLIQCLTIQQSSIEMKRNSLWAMTNLLREEGACADEILDMPHGTAKAPRLSARDVAMLLSAPEVFPPSTSNDISMDQSPTWNDVAAEACWLVSFLSRDPAAVNFLCAGDGPKGESNFISALVSRLSHDTAATSPQLDDFWLEKTACLIPCLRTLKNIAINSDGRYVHSLLLAEANDASSVVRTTELSLGKLLSFGTLGVGNDASNIAAEAASTVSVLLYDAGIPLPHPATRACQTLLPSLFQALISPLATFEFRREVLWALWDAVNFSPELCQTQECNMDVRTMQNKLLAEIMRTSPSEICRSLTEALTLDALEPSLRLIDILLRRLDSGSGNYGGKKLSTLFEEAGLVDALWRICDHDTEESVTAELAACLLDDFYEDCEEEGEQASPSLEPTEMNGQFQFGGALPPAGGFNFGAPAPPMGRGRGRGQVLPAWMQQQQQQS